MKPSLKFAISVLGLALCIASVKASAVALSNTQCEVDTSRVPAADQLEQVSVINCAGGESFEIKQIVAQSGKCSSSFWCSGFEHCVGGKCVSKDMFHRCDMFNTCSFGDKCVSGVCKH